MSKIQEILEDRKKEIRTQMSALQDELREVDTALGAILSKSGKPSRKRLKKHRQSIPNQIKEILSTEINGLPSREIGDQLRSHYGRNNKNSSVSWYLSQLKRDDEVEMREVGDEFIWSLPLKNETPDGSTSSVSITDDEGGASSSNENREIVDLLS